MVIAQGEVWWADLGEPIGSTAGYLRPLVIVQCDAFNRGRIATTLCVPLTSNIALAQAPGNVLLKARETGLERDSVANVSLTLAVDKAALIDKVGRISPRKLDLVFAGIDVVLGR